MWQSIDQIGADFIYGPACVLGRLDSPLQFMGGFIGAAAVASDDRGERRNAGHVWSSRACSTYLCWRANSSKLTRPTVTPPTSAYQAPAWCSVRQDPAGSSPKTGFARATARRFDLLPAARHDLAWANSTSRAGTARAQFSRRSIRPLRISASRGAAAIASMRSDATYRAPRICVKSGSNSTEYFIPDRQVNYVDLTDKS